MKMVSLIYLQSIAMGFPGICQSLSKPFSLLVTGRLVDRSPCRSDLMDWVLT